MTANAKSLKFTKFSLMMVLGLLIGPAHSMAAESAKVRELQERIQTLEKKFDDTKTELDKNRQAQEEAATKTVAAPEKKSSDTIAYKGITIKPGGFLASETVYRNNNNESDIGTSFQKIPFSNYAGTGQQEFRGTERQSRFSLLTQGDVDSTTHLAGYYELDFLGTSPTANPNESNSFTPRTRHVYLTADWDDSAFHILAGQNWSLTTLNTKGITPRNEYVPQTIESQYAVGFDWARQWQFRMVKDWSKTYWLALSLENSQTVGLAGAKNTGTDNTYQLPAGNAYNPSSMSMNTYPDIVLKFAAETDYGHYEIFDLARNFQSKYGPTGAANQTNKQNAWGNSVGIGAIVPVIPKTLDLALSGTKGKGLGRYGTSQLPDATYAEDGSLNPLNATHWLAQLAWHAAPTWEVYAAYGQETVDAAVGSTGAFGYGDGIVASNAGCSVLGGTCAPLVRNLTQSNLGFWWSFYKGDYGQAKFGMQYSHTSLGTFADASGVAPTTTQDMLFTSLRYYPF